MPSRCTASHVPPWAPSMVRAQAWDRLGLPSPRRPWHEAGGQQHLAPSSKATRRPVASRRPPPCRSSRCAGRRCPAWCAAAPGRRRRRSAAARCPSPARPWLGRRCVPASSRRARMRSARSSQSAWETASTTTASGAVGVDVGHHRVGHGLPGGEGRGLLVLPAVLGADGLAGRGAAGPQLGQGGPVDGVALAAVDHQRGGHDGAVGAQAGDLRRQAARADRLGLAGIAQAPQLRPGGGGHRLQHRRRVPGGDLGHLVEDDHRARGQGARRSRSRRRRAMVTASRPTERRPATAWLVVATPSTGRPAAVQAAAAAWMAVVLPNPAGAISDRRAEPGPHRARTAPAWSSPRRPSAAMAASTTVGVDAPAPAWRPGGPGGRARASSSAPVGHGGPLGRTAAAAGVSGPGGPRARRPGSPRPGPGSRAVVRRPADGGADALHHLGLGEAGVVGAQAGLGVDQPGDDLVGAQLDRHGPGGPTTAASTAAALSRPTALPSASQRSASRVGGEGVVLAGPGGERGGVVGPHARRGASRRRRPDASSSASMATVRLEKARSCSALKPTISRQPLRSGPHSTPRCTLKQALQLGLVDRPGRLGPVVQRVGVEGHVGAVGAAHHVGDQAVGVQLGVALPGGAVGEGGHREPGRGHPPAHALGLLAGHRRRGPPGTPQRRSTASVWQRDTTDAVSGAAQRPQERDALGGGEGGVEGVDACARDARPAGRCR